MHENLFPLSDIESEIKARGIKVSLEYPGYLQLGEMAFGHSLGYEAVYTWNNLEGNEYGIIPPLNSVQEIVTELLRQIEEATK